ncbi:MAG: SLC13 family permease [Candidatus Binataceae bacterium]
MADRSAVIRSGGLPERPEEIYLAPQARRADWKRISIILLGLLLFSVVYFSKAWPDALGPGGQRFPLTREGKASLALSLLALTWWVGEVVPLGVTSVAIGSLQALFLIRSARSAFSDFMDPAVWFIFGSLAIGMVFNKTGLTRRMAYRMLLLVGERTKMIYLGCFAMTAVMTLVMAHTAVAAAIFPLLMAVYSLYPEDDKPTRFGKGLFIGMAFAAGAGSIVTLLGSARAPVAVGFFKQMAGREISFLEMSYYMLPLGWAMAILLWFFCMIVFPPEKKTIPGLHERARVLHSSLGPMSRSERLALAIVLCTVAMLSARSFVPALAPLDMSAIILVSTVLFFLLRILELKDIEEIPWNIVLLFGGAMSIGLCLWQTGAASWLAVRCLVLFHGSHGLLFVLGIALFVLVMTNFILNVAAIAICLPVALALARYLNVTPEVILFSLLTAAGMPFLTLFGAAPNAIAHGGGQFTSREFFAAGVPASLMLLLVLGLFVWVIWPLMGMPVLTH